MQHDNKFTKGHKPNMHHWPSKIAGLWSELLQMDHKLRTKHLSTFSVHPWRLVDSHFQASSSNLFFFLNHFLLCLSVPLYLPSFTLRLSKLCALLILPILLPPLFSLGV